MGYRDSSVIWVEDTIRAIVTIAQVRTFW